MVPRIPAEAWPGIEHSKVYEPGAAIVNDAAAAWPAGAVIFTGSAAPSVSVKSCGIVPLFWSVSRIGSPAAHLNRRRIEAHSIAHGDGDLLDSRPGGDCHVSAA